MRRPPRPTGAVRRAGHASTWRAASGHIEVGGTAAILLVLAAIAAHAWLTSRHGWTPWLDWPWWGQAGSVLGAVFVLGLGRRFEGGRQWPKPPPPPRDPGG